MSTTTDYPQPSWKLPLILSAVLLVGGSLAYWYHYDQRPKKEKAETALKKPLALPSEETQIAMIKVKTAKGLIELKCEDLASKNCKTGTTGKWKITHPVELVADTDNVREYLNNATGLVSTENISLAEDTPEKKKQLIEDYGLSPEKRTQFDTQFVELIAEDGKRYTAWFGTEHPLGEKNFVGRSVDGQLNEDTIFVVASYYKSNLDKNLTFFRDKTLFTFARGDVESFEASTSHGKLSGKKVDGLWQVNGLPGEHDRIETALASIAKTLAKEFPEASEYRGAKPLVKYALKTKDKSFEIEVLEKTRPDQSKRFYARVNTRPETVEIDSILETQINKKLNDFRRQSIFSETEKVTATVFQADLAANASFGFELKNGAWTTKETAAGMDPAKVKALLDQLSQAKVSQFLSRVPAGKSEQVTLTIGDDKNNQKFRMRFSSVGGKLYGVDLLSKRTEAFELPETLKSALPFTPDAWKMKP